MQITHASQTDHIQHLKSASTVTQTLGCLVPDALSWPSKEGEPADSLIQLPLDKKQIEKGWGGNEKAAAFSGSCPTGVRSSETLPSGTRAAFPTGITNRFGPGLSGTPAQKEMFYFIPCIVQLADG